MLLIKQIRNENGKCLFCLVNVVSPWSPVIFVYNTVFRTFNHLFQKISKDQYKFLFLKAIRAKELLNCFFKWLIISAYCLNPEVEIIYIMMHLKIQSEFSNSHVFPVRLVIKCICIPFQLPLYLYNETSVRDLLLPVLGTVEAHSFDLQDC